MAEYNKISSGYFTGTAATAKFIPLAYKPTKFEIWNRTEWGSANATPQVQYGIGFSDAAAGSAYIQRNATGAATLEAVTLTSGGFTFIEAGTYQYGPTLIISGIVNSTGVVTTTTDHNLAIGDSVLLYGTTGMLQIAGTMTTVTAVGSSTTFTIGNIPTAGFAANATAGFVKKVLYADLYVPFNNPITAVTISTNTTSIATALNHSFVLGQEVFFVMPQTGFINTSAVWGVTGLDSLAYVTATGIPQKAIITSITNANTFVVNIGSAQGVSGTFRYPTSAQAALGITFPQVSAIGDQNFGFSGVYPLPVQPSQTTYTNTLYPQAITIPGAFLPNTRSGVLIGASLITNVSTGGAAIEWRAEYPDQYVPS